MVSWNPDQYLKFAQERTQPSVDLAARIALDSPTGVIDVGCGPGNSTRVLRQRWPNARVIGVDNSVEMIDKARREFPAGEWHVADAAALPEDLQYQVVFSNAVLQWVPDHRALLPRLVRSVAPGGCLAVQVPANHDSYLHRAVLAVAGRARWRTLLASYTGLLHYHTPEFYYGLLSAIGRVDMWQTTYYHVLDSHEALVAWYKGSGLRPLLDRLPDAASRADFENEVLDTCRPGYPAQSDGRVLFPFRRTFFVVYRPMEDHGAPL